MMPTQHTSNNDVLGAPKDWDQGAMPCGALAITRCDIDGLPCIMSFWRPSLEEINILKEGGTVALMVFGQGMPPVTLAASR
jgi:hypothetical protein